MRELTPREPPALRHRYVTPQDEHTGRGETIRQARRDGLAKAAAERLAYHRGHRKNQPNQEGPDVV